MRIRKNKNPVFVASAMNESNHPIVIRARRLSRIGRERLAANLLVSMLAPAANWFYAILEMKALAFCMFWFLIAPPAAYGDGCILPTAFVKVQIPDQRALIHFDRGMETLVIDTAFRGDGTNFAWIVPVPSAPKVEIATTGLFPTLQTIFQPEIIHNVPPFYWLAIIVGAFIFHISWKIRRSEHRMGAAIGNLAEVLLIWFAGLVVVGMILPNFVTAGVNGPPIGGVKVIERKRVGVYDTAVLSSRDGGALLDWLRKNGFVTPSNVVPAIQEYAKEGWFFVASKIRLDASLIAPAKPSPLTLTFKTERPAYPLRLTGVGNDTCQIDLYIFGPHRAEIPNFVVERCAMPLYPAPERESWRWGLAELRIRHAGLRTLVGQSPVATKLTARLNSRQMKEDAYITWTPFEEKRLAFYSNHGAAILTTNIMATLLVAALLAWFWTSGGQRIWVQRLHKASVVAVLAGALSSPLIYLLVPKIPVVIQRIPAVRNTQLHERFIPAFLDDEASKQGTNFEPDVAWVRMQLRENSIFRRNLGPDSQTNYFTGQPWQEEDSPGNWTARQTAEGIEYDWYDIEGGEHAVPLFRIKK
jgi:hypothetical protein